MTNLLQFAAAIISLLFGIWAFVQPVHFAKLVSLTPYKKRGITEMRATYGGLIIGMALFALLYQEDIVYQALAFGWFGVAIARAIGTMLDNSFSKMTVLFIGIEVTLGLMLFI